MLARLAHTLTRSRRGAAVTMQTLLANILILGINAGTGIITARILEPEGRGELAALILWPQFLAYVLAFGLPSALLYNLKRYPARASQLFFAALLLGTVLSLLTGLAGVLFIPHWLNEYSSEVVHFAQWLMLAAPLSLLGGVFDAVLQARGEFTLYNAFRYVPLLLTLLAVSLLALNQSLTPFTAALSYILPEVPVFLWMLVRLLRSYRPVWQDLSTAFKPLTSYGLRSYGVDLLATLGNQLDRVLVVGLLDPVMMGLYVVALSLAQMLHVFQAAVVAVLFPRASGRSVEEVTALAGFAMRASTAVTLFAAIGLAVLGPWVLGLLYGQEYLGAVRVFRILLLYVVLYGATMILAQALMALNRPGTVAILHALGLGLALPLLLVLVPRYGLEGAGLALLISTAVRFVAVIISFPLLLKVPIPRFRPTYSDLAAIIRMFH